MLHRGLSTSAALLSRLQTCRLQSMRSITRCFTQERPVREQKTAPVKPPVPICPCPSTGAAINQETAYKQPILDMLSLEGRVTVLTGAGRGIGLALARGAAELGSDIAILDTLESPHADFDELRDNFGVKVKYYRTDVTKPDALKSTFNQVVGDFGRIDHCVTAAGIALDKAFLDHEWEESMRVLNVNVMGTFSTVQFVSQQMRAQKSGGSIVMIASVASHCAIPSQRLAMYGASKGAVRILCQHLAVELAQYNIRINTISPGYIATDMTDALGVKHPELLSVFHSAAPIQRMGDRRDLKGIVACLLSDASAYITGADVQVTGGLHSGRI